MLKKIILALCIACAFSGLAAAQATNSTATGKPARDAKEVLRERLDEAHEMCNRYLYLFTRDTGTERHYRNYLWWLNRRGEIVKEMSGK